jgi:hypothetical protein
MVAVEAIKPVIEGNLYQGIASGVPQRRHGRKAVP